MWNRPPDTIHSHCELADGLESTQRDMELQSLQHLLLFIFLFLPLYHKSTCKDKLPQTAQQALLQVLPTCMQVNLKTQTKPLGWSISAGTVFPYTAWRTTEQWGQSKSKWNCKFRFCPFQSNLILLEPALLIKKFHKAGISLASLKLPPFCHSFQTGQGVRKPSSTEHMTNKQAGQSKDFS